MNPRLRLFAWILIVSLALGGYKLRGTPDGGFNSYSVAAQQNDTGQLASMLWGWAPIDGLGRLLYMDTWNNGLGGWTLNAAAGSPLPAVIDASYAGHNFAPAQGYIFSPPNAVAMYPQTGAITIERDFWLGTSKRLGFEAGLSLGIGASRTQAFSPDWQLLVAYNPPGLPYARASLRYDHTSRFWQVFTGTTVGGTWQNVVAGADLGNADGILVQIKMVADWGTDTYVRVLIGETSYNVSGIPLNTPGGSGASGKVVFQLIANQASGTSQGDGYAGYALITRDEP